MALGAGPRSLLFLDVGGPKDIDPLHPELLHAETAAQGRVVH
ncbi:hypothetical protein [Micromonospora sp. NPDC001898]